VAHCDVIQLPLIAQCSRYSLNIRIRRAYKMEPSKQNADMRIYFDRCFEDLFDAGMRTPIHNDQSLRATNHHSNFTQFERAGDLRRGRDNKNARSDLRR
jgi:hypothetical protein